MVKVIHKIQAEISKPNFFQAIVAKQFDSDSRFLNVTFVHEGNKIDLPNTATVTINATRNDGEKKKFAGTVNSDGTATVPLAYWMLELEGKVICDVSATDTSGRKLTTTNFTIEVERASCDSGDVSTDENYDVLLKLIEDVGKVTPDQTYDPTSTKAQSGIAVAQAVEQALKDFTPEQLQEDVAKHENILNGSAEISITDLSVYEQTVGQPNQNGAATNWVIKDTFKHIVIPVPETGCKLRMTANADANLLYCGLKSYTQPTTASSPLEYSDDAEWNKRFSLIYNNSIEKDIADDVKYILLVTLNGGLDATPSSFEIHKEANTGLVDEVNQLKIADDETKQYIDTFKAPLPLDSNGNVILPTEGSVLMFNDDGTTYYGKISNGGNSGGSDGDVDNGGGDDDGGSVSADTSPKIAEYDKRTNKQTTSEDLSTEDFTGGCVTEWYDMPDPNDIIVGSIPYNLTNIISSTVQTKDADGNLTWWDESPLFKNGSMGKSIGIYGAFTYNQFRLTLQTSYIEDSYLYWENTGDIIFAGKNTEYYGLKNIDGTPATDGTTDQIPPTEDIPSTDTTSNYGLSEEFFNAITNTIKDWQIECGGDYRKTPLVITTDQHNVTNKGIFDMLGDTLDMYSISKVVNLGDTVTTWVDADAEHLLYKDVDLEKWRESIKAIPLKKQLNVFGNHDADYLEGANNGIGRTPIGQARLYQYFPNEDVRITNNNGWFVTYDNRFNVKYVVISNFEKQTTAYGAQAPLSTEQLDFIIDEFSKDDGYDIVVLSHFPIYSTLNRVSPVGEEITDTGTYFIESANATIKDAFLNLINARKNKTSGTIKDFYNVEHSYDFSQCKNDILCGLHGHTHYDAFEYVGGMDNGLMNVSFDYFQKNYTVHFAIVDRANNQLNVWKVDDTATVNNYQIPFNKV